MEDIGAWYLALDTDIRVEMEREGGGNDDDDDGGDDNDDDDIAGVKR